MLKKVLASEVKIEVGKISYRPRFQLEKKLQVLLCVRSQKKLLERERERERKVSVVDRCDFHRC